MALLVALALAAAVNTMISSPTVHDVVAVAVPQTDSGATAAAVPGNSDVGSKVVSFHAHTSPAEQPTEEAAALPGETLTERIEAGVSDDGNGNYRVDQRVLNEIFGDPDVLDHHAPDLTTCCLGCQPEALFRMQGLRSGSLFAAMGLRNGDVVRRINGDAVDSPQRLMTFYKIIGDGLDVALVVQRRGQEQTLNYTFE